MSRVSRRSQRYSIDVPHQTLYPILVTASQRNKQILTKNIQNYEKQQNYPTQNQERLYRGISERQSLSPFRWTTKNFVLPNLHQKNLTNNNETTMQKNDQKNKNNLQIIKEFRQLATSRQGIKNNQKYKYKYDPNIMYRDDQQQLPAVNSSIKKKTIDPNQKVTNKIFIMKSKDVFLKKILLGIGWKQSKSKRTQNFHFKWTLNDSPSQYTNLKEGQYYNHIKNTDIFTNQAKLSQNIQKKLGFEFYPRTYNLESQYSQFIQDYNNTGVLCLLKKYAKYIKHKIPEIFQNPKSVQLGVLLKFNYYTDKSQRIKFSLNITLLISLCLYLQKMRKNMNIVYFQYQQGYIDVDINVQSKMIQTLLNYSKIPIIQKPNQKVSIDDKVLQTHISSGRYESPSQQILSLVVLYYKIFKKKLNYFNIDGNHNIWVLKSLNSSKDQGIQLINRIDSNLNSRLSNKLAQKYIQNCFLFQNVQKQQFMWKYVQGKKFDIRQYVLLTSEPKKILKFNAPYLRFCSETYNINKIKQQKKHSTNYHTNRGNLESNQEWSILSAQQLFNYVKIIKHQDIEKKFNQQIDKIIIQSMTNSLSKIQFKKNCFQFFGFDFIMDQNYKIWLLQINSSPTCQQKSLWLKQMLADMGTQFFKIILPENYIKPLFQQQSMEKRYIWKTIYQQNINKQQLMTPDQKKAGPKIKANYYSNPKSLIDFQIEGSLMKEIRNKLRAQKFFYGLVLNDIQLIKKQFINILKKVKPIKQHAIYNYNNISTLIKKLRLILLKRKKACMRRIKLEYYQQVTEDSDQNSRPNTRQIIEYYQKFYFKE